MIQSEWTEVKILIHETPRLGPLPLCMLASSHKKEQQVAAVKRMLQLVSQYPPLPERQ